MKNINKKNKWKCPKCGENHERDQNASKNIKKIILNSSRLDIGNRVTANIAEKIPPSVMI